LNHSCIFLFPPQSGESIFTAPSKRLNRSNGLAALGDHLAITLRSPGLMPPAGSSNSGYGRLSTPKISSTPFTIFPNKYYIINHITASTWPSLSLEKRRIHALN
jgi:hypothetical protein